MTKIYCLKNLKMNLKILYIYIYKFQRINYFKNKSIGVNVFFLKNVVSSVTPSTKTLPPHQVSV